MRLRQLGWAVLGLAGVLLALVLGPGSDLVRAHFGYRGGSMANLSAFDQVSLWPPEGATLPSDGRIVIEVQRAYPIPVEGLALATEAGEPVALKAVAEYWRRGVRQVVLAPQAALKPGLSYWLVGPDRLPLHGTGLDQAYHRVWKVAPAAAPVSWSGPPKVVGDNHCRWDFRLLHDCHGHPEKYVLLQAPANASLFRLRVEGDASAEYLVRPAHDGKVWVLSDIDYARIEGWKPGRGDFPLEEGKHYRITVTALDEAGGEHVAPGPPLEVEGFITG